MKLSDLISLGKETLSMFDEYIIDMNIKPPMRAYVRRFPTKLDVSETTRRCEWSSEFIQKPDWSMVVLSFVEQKVEPLPKFQELNQSIAKKYKKNINTLAMGSNELDQGAYWLEGFLQRLIYDKLEGKLSDECIIENASLFKSELELSPSEFRHVYYLDGIFTELESIQINDRVVIRKIQPADLEYTNDGFSVNPIINLNMRVPSSILEIEMSARDEKDCDEYAERLFNALRLYKLGSIYSGMLVSDKKTIIWPLGRIQRWSHRDYVPHEKYTVTKGEANIFVRFITAMEQRLDFSGSEKEYRSLSLSMERYNSALLESNNTDIRMMSAVMGLESLLTLEKDRGENAFKLSMRTARLLSNLGFDALKVKELTEQSYGFRNKVVHGSHVSQPDTKKMNDILPDILNYLRVSLTALLLSKNLGKDKMIDTIDSSAVSDVHNAELKKAIESNTGEFAKILS